MALARVGDIELSYERRGSGPPLLLIMGMSGTMLHWGEPFLGDLEGDFELILYDHRGVGESTPLQGRVTIAQMAEDAAGLLGALGIESAHVLGISMGGMIAQELALAHPEMIRTLALGCTWCGGPDGTQADPSVLEGLSAAMLSGDRAAALRAGWEANVGPSNVDDADAYARFVAISERYAVAVPVIMAQLVACMEHDTAARLGEIALPTLVVHGTEDRMLPVANGRQIAELIPGAQLEILDGIGHLFFWELPARSAELVRAHAGVPA